MDFKEVILKDGEGGAISPVTIASSIYTEEGNPYTGHNHDDMYYTETEIDDKLGTKSDDDHKHDGLYYTKSEVDAMFAETGNTYTYTGDN